MPDSTDYMIWDRRPLRLKSFGNRWHHVLKSTDVLVPGSHVLGPNHEEVWVVSREEADLLEGIFPQGEPVLLDGSGYQPSWPDIEAVLLENTEYDIHTLRELQVPALLRVLSAVATTGMIEHEDGETASSKNITFNRKKRVIFAEQAVEIMKQQRKKFVENAVDSEWITSADIVKIGSMPIKAVTLRGYLRSVYPENDRPFRSDTSGSQRGYTFNAV
ncbi:MAG: hypothetical protein AAGH99_14090 [Planctomycetota bacterium]